MNDNLVVIDALSNVITRHEDQSEEFEAFNYRQSELEPAVAMQTFIMSNKDPSVPSSD